MGCNSIWFWYGAYVRSRSHSDAAWSEKQIDLDLLSTVFLTLLTPPLTAPDPAAAAAWCEQSLNPPPQWNFSTLVRFALYQKVTNSFYMLNVLVQIVRWMLTRITEII